MGRRGRREKGEDEERGEGGIHVILRQKTLSGGEGEENVLLLPVEGRHGGSSGEERKLPLSELGKKGQLDDSTW